MGNMRFKAGDRVRIKSIDWYNENKDEDGYVICGEYDFVPLMSRFCGKILTIDVEFEDGACLMMEDTDGFVFTYEMIEGLVGEETLIERVDDSGLPFNEWLSHKGAFYIPDGYELKDENDNVINATKIVLEKKKKEYPKTYEECEKVLRYDSHRLNNMGVTVQGYKWELIRAFQILIICRDAYWKIAGEEMGLGKPWEPDYDSGVDKFGIICLDGVVQESNPTTNWERHLNKVLDFPTREMRDVFYEIFKKEIEICKELL